MSYSPSGLFGSVSFEVTSKQITKNADILARLDAGTEIYVPFLNGASLDDSLDACRLLSDMSLCPVPHVVARAMETRAGFASDIQALVDVGVDRLLLLRGDSAHKGSAFSSTLDMIDSGIIENSGINNVRFAGHPQGHADVNGASLDSAIDRKFDWSTRTGINASLFTQFAFEAGPVIEWAEKLRSRGIGLPVHVGIPGSAKITTVLAYAAQCGVITSARMLARRPSVSRLLSGWDPSELVTEFVDHSRDTTDTLIQGLHFFPFGGVKRTVEWVENARESVTAPTVSAAVPFFDNPSEHVSSIR